MELEYYFDFLSADDIRLKGTRISIETVLYAYIHQRHTADEIAQIYPQLTLEQIYATILYYLHNQPQIAQYLADWLNYCAQVEREQDESPPAIVARLKQIKAERNIAAYGLDIWLMKTFHPPTRHNCYAQINDSQLKYIFFR